MMDISKHKEMVSNINDEPGSTSEKEMWTGMERINWKIGKNWTLEKLQEKLNEAYQIIDSIKEEINKKKRGTLRIGSS